MQITLNQAEIETALTSYINDQVNLKEGVQIVIDLKAGRGPEGFSANIDISSGAKAPAVAAVAEKPKVDPKPEKVKPQTTTGAVAGAANNAGDKPETKPEVNEQEQQQEVQQEAEAQAEQQQETQEEAQAEVKPRTSLFGGLKKPTN